MRKQFLKTAREKLLDMRQQVTREMDEDLRIGRESSKEEGMDTYDLASQERDREISFLLTDRDRAKIQAIQEALDRIDSGEYGVCENCDADIAEGRLLALPFTQMCVSCQSDYEKEAKAMRGVENDRAYRRLSSADLSDDDS